MAKKRFSPEQVVAKLRQIEVLTAGGKALPLACKEAGITDTTYYRWRKEYGGLKSDQAKRLTELHRVFVPFRKENNLVDHIVRVTAGQIAGIELLRRYAQCSLRQRLLDPQS